MTASKKKSKASATKSGKGAARGSPAKSAAARKPAPGKAAPARAAGSGKASGKQATPAKTSGKASRKGGAAAKPARGERDRLIAALAAKLGVPKAEAELRALRDFTTRIANTEAEGPPSRPTSGALGLGKNGDPATGKAAAPPAREGGLPQRLFLLLDGRGLDGHGLPIEVIETTATIGSGKFCTVWINSPQIETRHLQIQQDGDAWVLSDLNSTHGTLLGEEPLAEPRVVAHGDEYRLAGYLRMRTELR